MKIEMWDIDRPLDCPTNARRHSERAIKKLAASLKFYGFRQPLVVDGEGVIIIGHARRRAARSIGLKKCPVHVAADLSPEQVRGLRLMDNRIHQESIWDNAQLQLELSELKSLSFDLGMTGFDSDQIIPDCAEVFAPESAPPSVQENVTSMERIAEIHRVRTKGREQVVSKNDTERYLIIVFPSRQAKEDRLRLLGLPVDERYISSNAVQIQLIGENLVHEKAAPRDKAGACG